APADGDAGRETARAQGRKGTEERELRRLLRALVSPCALAPLRSFWVEDRARPSGSAAPVALPPPELDAHPRGDRVDPPRPVQVGRLHLLELPPVLPLRVMVLARVAHE